MTQGFPPMIGGSERYHFLTARALSERVEVRVFTSAFARPASPDRADPDWTLPDGVVRYLPSLPLLGEKLPIPTSLWRALSEFDPDLVWGNHPSPTADLGALFALLHHRPWIATYHADVRGRVWIDRRYQAWEDRLLPRATRLFVTTDHYARALAARGVPAERIRTVPTGPYLRPPPSFAPAGGAPEAPGPEHPFLFVGVLDRAHAYKGLERLLEAVAGLARQGLKVDLEVVGDGPERPGYEGRSTELGLAGQVRFLGRLDDAALAGRFAAAWALVLPSGQATEGFGTAAVDGFLAGCPVLLSRALPAAELFVRLGVAYPVADGSVEELARGLRALWTDPAARRRLAERTPAARAELSWDHLLPRLLGPVYATLGLPEGPAGPSVA